MLLGSNQSLIQCGQCGIWRPKQLIYRLGMELGKPEDVELERLRGSDIGIPQDPEKLLQVAPF